MRTTIVIIIGVLFGHLGQAQIYEGGFFLGGSNLIGDVGATNYISPNAFAVGGLIKWNRSPRHAWRASMTYSNFEAKDFQSDDPRRKKRDYFMEQRMLEVSIGLEFTFFDFNMHYGGFISTPYLYTGISVIGHNDSYFKNGKQTLENTRSFAFGIPMTVGYKIRVSEHILLAAEIGLRYTFTDGLDGSMPANDERKEVYAFGNINNNDWYTFTGITLTYTFGRKPCYCNF